MQTKVNFVFDLSKHEQLQEFATSTRDVCMREFWAQQKEEFNAMRRCVSEHASARVNAWLERTSWAQCLANSGANFAEAMQIIATPAKSAIKEGAKKLCAWLKRPANGLHVKRMSLALAMFA